MPFHIEADRHWTLRSWDRTQIPKPFSPRRRWSIGEPLDVPPDADDAEVEAHRTALETVLARLRQRAIALVGREA